VSYSCSSRFLDGSARLAKPAKPTPGNKHILALFLTKLNSTARADVKNEVAAQDPDFGKFLELIDEAWVTNWMRLADIDETKSEDDDFEKEEVISAPKRKRQRITQAAKPTTRKKHVRGKQGRLEGLMRMPIDIFIEVCQALSFSISVLIASRSHCIFCLEILLSSRGRTSSSTNC
jgi:hypothetical protein